MPEPGAEPQPGKLRERALGLLARREHSRAELTRKLEKAGFSAADIGPLLDGFEALARDANCSMAQLALAWLLARGEHVLAIPGTTSIAHLEENVSAADVHINAEMMARLDALINQQTVTGNRYSPATELEIDTETY